jgi:hypothetical protein
VATSPSRLTISVSSQLITCGYSPYVTSSLTRGCVCRLQLLLVLASAVILRSESPGFMTIFYCLRYRFSQPECPGPLIYIPQKEGGLVIPPVTGFPFHPFLLLAGIRWNCSNTSPHGRLNLVVAGPRYITSARTPEKTRPTAFPLLLCE